MDSADALSYEPLHEFDTDGVRGFRHRRHVTFRSNNHDPTKLSYADGTIEGAFAFSRLNRAICVSMTNQSGQTAVRSKLLRSSKSPAALQAIAAQISNVLDFCGNLARSAPSRLAALVRTSLAALTWLAGVRRSFEKSKRRPRCSVMIPQLR